MPNDPKADLERYLGAMGDPDFDRGLAICVEIEKRYGLYGLPPQEVHRSLNLLIHDSQPQETTPNVQNNQT